MTQPSVHQLFRRLETVGKGAYGSVHKGVHIPTGNLVALKIINLDTAEDDVGDIQREVTLLTQLRDAPNVTKYYGCYLDGPRVWIAMELAQGGSVRTLMKSSKGGVLEEKYIVIIVREVLLGLNYLHKSAIIHRDIKAANILITALGKVMICDFGVSALSATTSSKRNTLMGTPNWMAPEVAQPVPAYDSKADIWSLGIMVYEMVKGTPPHADLMDPLKVMSLITRVKPPRLGETEGSKDMRDFVASCLRELPGDRLTAEELGKTKWIKAISKEKVSTLRELILRYDAWLQGGGTRASLAEPLAWEKEEEYDMQDFGVKEDNPWEFDTVRGRSFNDAPSVDDSFIDTSTEEMASPSTVRPRAPARLPSSLRGLFDDESSSSSEADLFRPPTLQVPGLRSTPSPPSSSSPSPSPSRDRAAHKRVLVAENNGDDLQTAKPTNLAFPPRTSTPRNKSKLSASVPGSEDEDALPTLMTRKERPPPLGPGIPSTLTATSSSSGISDGPDRNRGNANYRERSASRGLPNIEILPLPQDPNLDLASANSLVILSSNLDGSSQTPQITPIPKPPINRKRSQSSVTGLASRTALASQRDRNLAAPGDFQFPLPSNSDQSLSAVHPLYTHSKVSPNHASVSSTSSISSSAHQTTYSLDASAASLASRRLPPAGSLPVPPSMHRARSANAIPDTHTPATDSKSPGNGPTAMSRRPSVSRQASVAVMEHVQSSPPPLIPPSKPFARPTRDRSGSGSSRLSDGNISAQSLGLPGLKDVLKIPTLTSDYQLGMSDLLPPSPSTMNYSSRVFAPSPSMLSSSVAQTDSSATKSVAASANTSTSSLGFPRTSSPPLFDPSQSYSFSNNTSSSFNSSPSNGSFGPAIRPLDFGALMHSHEGTHTELARTVEDLTQWLSVVENGLSEMLDNSGADTITEEQEDYTHNPELRTDVSRSAHTLKFDDSTNGMALAAKS